MYLLVYSCGAVDRVQAINKTLDAYMQDDIISVLDIRNPDCPLELTFDGWEPIANA